MDVVDLFLTADQSSSYLVRVPATDLFGKYKAHTG